MIRKEGLRNGNWLLKEGIPYKLNEKDISQIDELLFEPIPITEDIILQCGFMKHVAPNFSIYDDRYYYSLGYFCLLQDFANLLKPANSENNFANDYYHAYIMTNELEETVIIRSLHDLQNAYFDLTGTFLAVNL